MPRQAQIQVRRDTAANWTVANPTLASGEIGFETDTLKFKIGDGATAWTTLAYAGGGGGGGISTITSSASTITVGSPSGPTTNVDLPTTGVGAATYGDATHVGQFTVDSRGRITAASSVIITGSGGSGVSRQVPLPLAAPDASGNGYSVLTATANVRMLTPAFLNGVDGFWWGVLRVPADYNANGTIVLRVAANDTTGHVSRWLVSTKARDTTATWDAALTAETAQNLTMSTTAYRPSDVTFTLSTTPVAGGDLIFAIERNGANAADTLTVPALLVQAVFQYTL